MKSIRDYPNPFVAVKDFEQLLREYTGAPYAIVTDSCTHAIEIALRIKKIKDRVTFPSKTYLSVLMTMHKLNIPYHLTDLDWFEDGIYQLQGTDIWDCARKFSPGMYQPGTTYCLSFGRTKPLEIGKGGCILTDDQELAEKAHRMRFDGRDILNYTPWVTQKTFEVGYHYYLRPEECITGINLLESGRINQQPLELFNYPDCREISIVS